MGAVSEAFDSDRLAVMPPEPRRGFRYRVASRAGRREREELGTDSRPEEPVVDLADDEGGEELGVLGALAAGGFDAADGTIGGLVGAAVGLVLGGCVVRWFDRRAARQAPEIIEILKQG